jgi:hypothetical protein
MIVASAPAKAGVLAARTARPVVLTSLLFAYGGPADGRPAAACARRWKSLTGASKPISLLAPGDSIIEAAIASRRRANREVGC